MGHSGQADPRHAAHNGPSLGCDMDEHVELELELAADGQDGYRVDRAVRRR